MLIGPAQIITGGCLLSMLALLAAELRSWDAGKVVFKLAASTFFVWLAFELGSTESHSGRLMLLAFALCWVGDACLLSQRSSYFMAGLGAFLLGHAAFAAAFATASKGALPPTLALGAVALVGMVALRWLWPRLNTVFRFAVSAYVLAIACMCALAIGLSASTGVWVAGLGAMAFAVSDLAVARDQFIASTPINKLWGLPLYYGGQLLIAWSQYFHGNVAV